MTRPTWMDRTWQERAGFWEAHDNIVRGYGVSDDQLALFMEVTEGVPRILFALGDVYVLAAKELERERQKVAGIIEARRRLAEDRSHQ